MFYPWDFTKPADQQQILKSPFVPGPVLPPTPPVQQQLDQLIQCFQSFFESQQTAGQNYINQRQFEDLNQAIAMNPLQFLLPAMAQANVFSQWQNQWAGENQPTTYSALGLTREYQENWNALIKQQQLLLQAYGKMMEVICPIIQNVSNEFAETLQNPNSTDNFDQLCRKWIELCETEYQKIVATPEYSQALGQLMNASARFQLKLNETLEKSNQLQGNPSRSELNELHQKYTSIEAELSELKQQISLLQAKLSAPQ